MGHTPFITLPLSLLPGAPVGFWMTSGDFELVKRYRRLAVRPTRLILQWSMYGSLREYSSIAGMFEKYPSEKLLGDLDDHTVIVEIPVDRVLKSY
jgi:hypothetical protein